MKKKEVAAVKVVVVLRVRKKIVEVVLARKAL